VAVEYMAVVVKVEAEELSLPYGNGSLRLLTDAGERSPAAHLTWLIVHGEGPTGRRGGPWDTPSLYTAP
jgi:hypothetical protein